VLTSLSYSAEHHTAEHFSTMTDLGTASPLKTGPTCCPETSPALHPRRTKATHRTVDGLSALSLFVSLENTTFKLYSSPGFNYFLTNYRKVEVITWLLSIGLSHEWSHKMTVYTLYYDLIMPAGQTTLNAVPRGG